MLELFLITVVVYLVIRGVIVLCVNRWWERHGKRDNGWFTNMEARGAEGGLDD